MFAWNITYVSENYVLFLA